MIAKGVFEEKGGSSFSIPAKEYAGITNAFDTDIFLPCSFTGRMKSDRRILKEVENY